MKIKLSILLVSIFVSYTSATKAADKGIVHNVDSPHVEFRSINIGDAKWTNGFWADKFKLVESAMVPYMGELLKGDIGHGYNNFKIAAGLKEGKAKGFQFHDGDFYKWMESTAYLYAINKDKALLKQLDEIIAVIGKAQRPDGYLQTHSIIKGIPPYENRKAHEMYNSGHLINAAIIHHRVTGKTNFLDIAIKNANLIYDKFHTRPKKLRRFGFNQTQIVGLVELYRETKDKRYLKLAEQFINARGGNTKHDESVRLNMTGDMTQERTPFRKEGEAVGHAVLAMYFYAGAADVYAETGEKALLDALNRVWSNATEKKMYLTGAVGQAHHGVSSNKDMVHEAFLGEYDMPNSTAYNETCANITNAMFNWRMLSLTGEAKHADVIETVVYNSALSGISADGKAYFYTNPLRRSHRIHTDRFGQKDVTATIDREAYLNCFCCPPNLVRTLAKLSGWAYNLTDNGLAVNLYGGNTLDTTLLDGSNLKLTQTTNYPWDGSIKIEIDQVRKSNVEFQLRIPGWAKDAVVKVNDKALSSPIRSGQYTKINRVWKRGDQITVEMPMPVDFIEGNPLIEQIRNQVAVRRGPIVYLAESPDLPKSTDILDVYLSSNTQFTPKKVDNFSGNNDQVVTLEGELLIRTNSPENKMYDKITKPDFKAVKAQLVPYYAWSNRGQAEMSVFFPIVWGDL